MGCGGGGCGTGCEDEVMALLVSAPGLCSKRRTPGCVSQLLLLLNTKRWDGGYKWMSHGGRVLQIIK